MWTTPIDSAWEPTWPECTLELPNYPRWQNLDYWCCRIRDSDLQPLIDAAAARRREAKERERQQQTREAAERKQRAEVAAGLARLGRGEVSVEPAKKTRNRPPANATLMALGYAMAMHNMGHPQPKAAEMAVDAIPGVSSGRVEDLLKEVAAGKR